MLLPGREMRAAVLLPANLVGFGTLRPLLAVADGPNSVPVVAELNQHLLGRTGALIAERGIVLGGTAFVAVAFHDDGEVRILGEYLLQESGVLSQRIARVRPDIALVVIKEGILRLALQQGP